MVLTRRAAGLWLWGQNARVQARDEAEIRVWAALSYAGLSLSLKVGLDDLD